MEEKENSFDVIAPSLPGFGFLNLQKKPMGQERWQDNE